MIRLGLVGCGRWGRHFIAAARESGEAEVGYVAGSNLPELPPGVFSVGSREWRKLLDAPVDAFVVATPASTHEEVALEVLGRGQPVMIEKPLTLSIESTCRVLATAARARVPLLVDHVHLFAPAYEELRARVLDWPAFTVLSSGGSYGPVRDDCTALWDYGPHDVAMFLGLAGDAPARLTGASRVAGAYHLRLEAGKKTGLVRLWNDAPRARALGAMLGPDHVLVYDDVEPAAKLTLNGKAIPVSPERPLTRAVRAFARAARTGETCWRFDPVLAVETTKLLALAEKAVEARRENDDGNHG